MSRALAWYPRLMADVREAVNQATVCQGAAATAAVLVMTVLGLLLLLIGGASALRNKLFSSLTRTPTGSRSSNQRSLSDEFR